MTVEKLTAKTKLLTGGHLSIAGGYENALKKTIEIGGNCLQVFSASPRMWRHADPSSEEIKAFLKTKKELNIDPVYFHANYLINLGDDGKTGFLSVQTLVNELTLAAKMGVKGSVVHLGSFKDKSGKLAFENEKYGVLLKKIKEVLKKTPKQSLFIIENAGTKKIGKSIDEIEKIIKDVDDERVKVCLDTCHLHAAGYDLSTKKSFDNFINNFDKKIGIKKLEFWHINDSRDLPGSFRDRHENIKEGKINPKTFKFILNSPKTKKSPFIIETPGFDGMGPDKKNLDILKKMAG